MASQPFKRAFLKSVKEGGGWSPIFDRVAAGETLTAIAKDYGCSRSWLSRLLNEDHKRRELLRASKREAASAHVEQAMEIVDNAPVERDALEKARLQAEQRRWMAGKYDREQFSDPTPGVSVHVIGEMHLAALRHKDTTGERGGPQSAPCLRVEAGVLRHRDASSEVQIRSSEPLALPTRSDQQ